VKISYGITVHNEADELFKLTDLLINKIDDEDEIVICVDGNDEKVKLVLENLQKTYQWNSNIIIYQRKLDGNFAEHKNSVIEKSTGDYIFHIDADEYPHETLLLQLKPI
jgi:glycosyltransferase involved in cell wall biosynthesis